ncbi:MAG: phosphatidate cytidylyltransferase [Flavobacteriales bacterium]|nr:phosphatidate cytidylyltransferase [Flavobacteriales bacterium]
MKETMIRSMTGLLFALVVLGAIMWNTWSNLALWGLVSVMGVAEWRRPQQAVGILESIGFSLVMVVLSGMLLGMVWDPIQGFDPSLMLAFILLIWTNDTGAYLIGKPIGKHKLMPRVSPGKSWEGLLGGMALASLVASVVLGMNFWWVGGLIGATATAGDLVESAWKRKYGMKDSGAILPGHGGILDRFDGFLFAVPLFSLLDFWFQFDSTFFKSFL